MRIHWGKRKYERNNLGIWNITQPVMEIEIYWNTGWLRTGDFIVPINQVAQSESHIWQLINLGQGSLLEFTPKKMEAELSIKHGKLKKSQKWGVDPWNKIRDRMVFRIKHMVSGTPHIPVGWEYFQTDKEAKLIKVPLVWLQSTWNGLEQPWNSGVSPSQISGPIYRYVDGENSAPQDGIVSKKFRTKPIEESQWKCGFLVVLGVQIQRPWRFLQWANREVESRLVHWVPVVDLRCDANVTATWKV